MSIIDDIIAWALANTLKALWRILNAIVFFFPNAIMNLLLTLLGWGAAGPIGGFYSFARFMMSFFGVVPAGGWYAIFQSARMGGYGATVVAYWIRVWAVLTSILAYLFGRG